jgi:outer membrane protein assembly factor BamA
MGITFNGLYDSRDNAVNPMHGSFAQLSFRLNPDLLSTRASSSLYYEYRTYFALRKTVQQQHTIALWTWGQFQTSGSLPYLALPSITWDMYNRSGRGYIQGRLRGENFWYGEAAYRMPLTANGLFGAVAFFNLTTASNQLYKQKLGDNFAPGYGLGFRIKMDKKTNTNITIDYGIGRNGNSAIYFNLQEAF